MKQYIVDAFTDQLFHGNQAAVCLLDDWPREATMQAITAENRFSETAFTKKAADGYDLRWFTPGGEISLCGHATLATAYVLFRFIEKEAEAVTFHTMSGDLFIGRKGDAIVMDFPAYALRPVPVTREMTEAMGAEPVAAYVDRDLLLVYGDESAVRSMKPDFGKAEKLPGLGIAVTAAGRDYDCVSRFFAPKLGVEEDPVTGSAHCMIAPYWQEKLGKARIHAYQASARGGEMWCECRDGRVVLEGKAVLYSEGTISVGD